MSSLTNQEKDNAITALEGINKVQKEIPTIINNLRGLLAHGLPDDAYQKRISMDVWREYTNNFENIFTALQELVNSLRER